MKGIMNWFTNKLAPGILGLQQWRAQCRKSCRLFW